MLGLGIVLAIAANSASTAPAFMVPGCGLLDGVASKVWSEPVEKKNFVQTTAVPVQDGLILTEVQRWLYPKSYKLNEAIALPAPLNFTVPAGTYAVFWRDNKGGRLCIGRQGRAFWTNAKFGMICLKDQDGDTRYETVYARPVALESPSDGDLMRSLARPVTFQPVDIGQSVGKSQSTNMGQSTDMVQAAGKGKAPQVSLEPEYLYGARILLSQPNGKEVTVKFQTVLETQEWIGPNDLSAYYRGVAEQRIDLSRTPKVNVAGYRLNFDMSDPNTIKVSVTGRYVTEAFLECEATVAVFDEHSKVLAESRDVQ